MNARRLAVALGSAAFFGAVAIVAGALEVSLARPTIALVGLLALAVGLSALSGRRSARARGGTPDPERRAGVPTPGRSLADTADGFRGMTAGYDAGNRRLTDGLRAAAVAALTRFDGDSIERANRRLEDGTWTDDPIAAGFLSDSADDGSAPSLRDRLTAMVTRRSEPSFREGVRHSIAAIAAIGADRETENEADAGDERTLPVYEHAPESAARSRRPTRTSSDTVDGVESRRRRSTGHWTGVGAVALFSVGIGAIAGVPALVLAGVVGVGYAGFARALEPPELDVTLERTLSDDAPEPGDEVDVTLTVTNESGGFVPDLRLVDGVPAGMTVTAGSSRLGTALRPGESVSLEYTVIARRGSHAFDPALVLARDLSRSGEREFVVGTETTVVCEPSMRPIATPVPLRTATTAYAGRIRTDAGGSGTTIHSVREYRKSDPLNRIDWNRRAKTGDLATLEFHEERAARVVVLVDARSAAYLAPTPDAAHAVDRSVDAAARIGATLLEAGESVGLAAIGSVDRDGSASEPVEPCWLPPGSGRDHEARFRESLATHPQFSTRPPEHACAWRRQLRTIRRRLSSETQLVLLTPLCDLLAVDIARRLEAHGHPVTVVSPDPTAERTAGQRLSRVARRVRRADLQRTGVPVVDWPAGESLETVFARRSAGGRR